MAASGPRQPDPSGVSRRTFLQAGAAAAALGGPASAALPGDDEPAGVPDVEWRNKQPDMAYRRLGRTGMMISEVVAGGDPITLDNFEHMGAAIERGLNYLDMAPMYNDGSTERAFGKLVAGSSRRDKVFLTTKVSGFNQLRDRMYKEVFDGLTGEKQEAIVRRATELRAERGVDTPGYFLEYFPGQPGSLAPTYLRIAMMPDYAHRVEGSQAMRDFIVESIEGSLERVGTDHFDLVMCPHGADAPEDVQCPEIFETFDRLKEQGKVRFLGMTAHNDPAGVLRSAVDAGRYDAAMVAYNVINGGYVEEAIRHAAAHDVGVIAMKVAMAVATHHEPLQPTPEWRVQKVERVVPGDWKAPVKAYLWSLQNPNIAGVISNLWDEDYIRENLAVAGRKVELQPA